MKSFRIDFKECLKDSPKFRASLEEAEQDVDVLEVKLEKLMKQCNGMLDAGKIFSAANSSFLSGLRDVAVLFRDDNFTKGTDNVSDALNRFTHMLTELQKYQNILLEQACRSVVKTLTNFIKGDIKKVKETKKHFDKISNDTDAALVRNAQVLRSKATEAEDAANTLTAMYSCFCHVSLDYVFQLNILHSRKKFEVLDAVLSYMHAQNTFFHQGYDLFADAESYLKDVAAQSEQLNIRAAEEKKEMENRHMLVQLPKTVGPSAESTTSSHTPVMEGYLFKRTSSTFKTWVRRWFMIVNNQLVYRKRTKDDVTIMEEDLRLCNVRPSNDGDRRFCLEIVSPGRSHTLQADSEADCQAWVLALQSAVSKAYDNRNNSVDETANSVNHGRANAHSYISGGRSSESLSSQGQGRGAELQQAGGGEGEGTTEELIRSAGSIVKRNKLASTLPKASSRLETIMSVDGNRKCCDCGHSDPAWASINLGITLCIECSGIHRSFGVHMSKVRGITLDAWEPDSLRVMAELGNTAVNKIYEANVDESIAKRATAHSTRPEREAWIKAKYVQKAFIHRLPLLSGGATSSPVTPSADKSFTPYGGSADSRRWSVCRKKRPVVRRSGRGRREVACLETVGSDDNCSIVSRDDVIVFGAGVNSSSVDPELFKVIDSGSEDSLNSDDDVMTRDDNQDDNDDDNSLVSLEDLSSLCPDSLLYKSARARNLHAMLEALALGANVNWINEKDFGRTPLIQAVRSGSMSAMEFLLLNGAKVDIRDKRGHSPLHHATILGHTGQVCQLVKRNANLRAVDEQGLDPLTIAVNNANADIVTLLRLAKLNEEMKDYDITGDETVNDVFRDFTNLASIAPERLNRNK